MRRTIAVLLLLLAGRGLAAQTATVRWEYGKLTTVNNHPFAWNGGGRDSVLIANQHDIESAQNSDQQFLAFLNFVGGQGWELITSDVHGLGATYLFKRRL